MNRTLVTLSSLLLLVTSLPGCVVFLDDDDGGDVIVVEEPSNVAPFIISGDTWWRCDWDEGVGDYWFEFQAVVEDDDGPRDVEFVDISAFAAWDPDLLVDSFGLLYEGDGVWGGVIWEHESNLYCGDPIDVLVEAWDTQDGHDSLTIEY